jgi:hypothetical protein
MHGFESKSIHFSILSLQEENWDHVMNFRCNHGNETCSTVHINGMFLDPRTQTREM